MELNRAILCDDLECEHNDVTACLKQAVHMIKNADGYPMCDSRSYTPQR